MMIAICRMVNAVRLTGRDRLPARDRTHILVMGERPVSLNGRIKMMYRVIIIVSGALALAACASNLDALKPSPIMDAVRFESEPPGAEAKTSNGQTCRTPCAIALPVNVPLTVTFTLNGYQPETENIEPISMTGTPTQLGPNPVVVELTPAPKSVKKPAPKRKTSAKPATRTRPATSNAPAPAPVSAAPAQQQAPAPWPSAPPPQR
jgi:hypothetical protein